MVVLDLALFSSSFITSFFIRFKFLQEEVAFWENEMARSPAVPDSSQTYEKGLVHRHSTASKNACADGGCAGNGLSNTDVQKANSSFVRIKLICDEFEIEEHSILHLPKTLPFSCEVLIFFYQIILLIAASQ